MLPMSFQPSRSSVRRCAGLEITAQKYAGRFDRPSLIPALIAAMAAMAGCRTSRNASGPLTRPTTLAIIRASMSVIASAFTLARDAPGRFRARSTTLSALRRQPIEFQLDVDGHLQQLCAIVPEIVQDFETDGVDGYQLPQIELDGTSRPS